jgi:hypothetical protein
MVMERKPITSGQKKAYERLVQDILCPIASIAINQLSEDHQIDFDGLQRVLERGNVLKPRMIEFLKRVTRELRLHYVGMLDQIFDGEVFDVPETNGKDTLHGCGLFQSHLTARGNIHASSKPTAPASALVYRVRLLNHEKTSEESLLEDFGGDMRDRCWQESQIVRICMHHYKVINFDGFTVFPMESCGQVYFVRVVNGVAVTIQHFYENSEGGVTNDFEYRFVVPKLNDE